VVMVETRNEVG